MESIMQISKGSELAQRPSEKLSLTTASGISQLDGMACLALMKQTRDRYTNQTITEESAEMHLVQWEEMALRFGIQAFRDGLSKVIRGSKFFPDPLDIEETCGVAKRDADKANDAAQFIRRQDEMKALCARERAEDLASGRQMTEQEKRLDEVLKAQGRRG